MKKAYILILTAVFIMLSAIILFSCTRTVVLYFASVEDNEFYLVPETRDIEATGDIHLEAVRQLIQGPRQQGSYPTLPSDVKVNSVKVSERLAVVDFDIRIISNMEEIPHSSSTETLAIYSIVNTLTAFEEIDRVRITIEGKESGPVHDFYVEDFWGHIGIYEEFERNEELIKNG